MIKIYKKIVALLKFKRVTKSNQLELDFYEIKDFYKNDKY